MKREFPALAFVAAILLASSTRAEAWIFLPCDDIERAGFTVPDEKELDGHGISRGIGLSPDGHAFFVVTEVGHCDTNESESVIRVFQVPQVKAYADAAAHGRYARRPPSHVVARLFATSNDPLIASVQWMPDSRHLVFRGTHRSDRMRVYIAGADGAALQALTPAHHDVSAFALQGSVLVYTTSPRDEAVESASKSRAAAQWVVTGEQLNLLLDPILFQYLGPQHKLWTVENGQPRPVIDPGTNRQIELDVDYYAPQFSLSSDGRHLLAAQTTEKSASLSVLEHSPIRSVRIELASGRLEAQEHGATDSTEGTAYPTKAQRVEGLEIYVRQGLNDWPRLYAQDVASSVEVEIWDPAPQLANAPLAPASLIRWKDASGREWIGGMVMPRAYVSGARYPLVIQTRGFREREFFGNGFQSMPATSNVMAAQTLAGYGFVVVQVGEQAPGANSPDEARVNVPGYAALIDTLVERGLVNRERVGITAFSRSGISLVQAIVDQPGLFAAAVDYDSFLPGYMQYLMSVDEKGRSEERASLVGAQPFGVGLETWLRMSPLFNLDRVETPLRVSAGKGFASLLPMWELYAGLRLQGKPVELVWHPTADHLIRKPLERRASLEGVVDWYRFWLKREEDPASAKAEQYERWRGMRALGEARSKD